MFDRRSVLIERPCEVRAAGPLRPRQPTPNRRTRMPWFYCTRLSGHTTLLFATGIVFFSRQTGAQMADSARSKPQVSAPIQDNSFLIEEAYNQTPGVVQHISG